MLTFSWKKEDPVVGLCIFIATQHNMAQHNATQTQNNPMQCKDKNKTTAQWNAMQCNKDPQSNAVYLQ